jgi:hypothetical protein
MDVVIVVPCKNERGNIYSMADQFSNALNSSYKLVYVVGESNDKTFEECLLVQSKFNSSNIEVEKQIGIGKFGALTQVVLDNPKALIVIWDGDNSIKFSDVEKCIDRAIQKKPMSAVFGNRLNESLEKKTMPTLNYVGNVIFSRIASFVFKTRINDVLCGLKIFPAHVLLTEDMQNLSVIFKKDTFGDLTVVYGVSKHLGAVENVKVKYYPRVYGSTKLKRFRNGLELIRNLIFAFRKIHADNK